LIVITELVLDWLWFDSFVGIRETSKRVNFTNFGNLKNFDDGCSLVFPPLINHGIIVIIIKNIAFNCLTNQ
jgi:hypothetical protein